MTMVKQWARWQAIGVIDSTYTEYVFTLRGDVLWQDGRPFTARDVAFTIGILQQPSFNRESKRCMISGKL
jgi:ABC-type transport system substrate-binding protein